MNLLIRFLWVIIHSFFRPKLNIFDTSVLKFRVLPNDLDFNIHMTNSRYLSIMDLGRIDLLIRSGMTPFLLKYRWKAVIGSATIRFRRALRPFQSYRLITRLLNVDEKWFYIEHRFESKGQLVAYGLVRAIFIGPQGSVTPQEFLRALGVTYEALPLKKFLLLWNQMENAMRDDGGNSGEG